MFNEVILIGRVGKKASGHTVSQNPFTNFSLATTKSFKDKQTGEWKESTEWHQLVSFNACAEHIAEKVEAGDLLLVKGELRTRKWTDAAGIDRYTTEIVVSEFPRKLPRFFTQSSSLEQPSTVKRSSPAKAVGQDFNDDDIMF
jgi:single-strand DNA-binding protein